MKTIYVAGPYRDKNSWLVEHNIRCAEEVSYKIACLGALPVCPHTMFRYFNGTLTDQFWLKATQELLLKCDAVILLLGWENSEGSRIECELALSKSMPIFYQQHTDWVTLINSYILPPSQSVIDNNTGMDVINKWLLSKR